MINEKKIYKGTSGWQALSPLPIFLCLYLVTSILVSDFYKASITVASLASSCYTTTIARELNLERRVYRFLVGASNKNIILTVWIFILTGAFAQSVKQMGAIDATISLTLHVLPDNPLLASIFLTPYFTSLSIGTNVGTIVALALVAIELAERADIDLPFMAVVVMDEPFFGNNLLLVSGTTIAPTKTQECMMRDRLRVNSIIVAPIALVVLGVYIFQGLSVAASSQAQEVEWAKVIPYLVALGTVIAGVSVIPILIIGTFTNGVIGIATGSLGFFNWLGAMGMSTTRVGELIIIALLVSGMPETTRYNGRVDFAINRLTWYVSGKREAESNIVALVSTASLCMANDTIVIITTGSITKDIAKRFHLNRRRTMSILDAFSYPIQGVIPYGAQMLIAAELVQISPSSIIGNLYYPSTAGIYMLLTILSRYPRRYSRIMDGLPPDTL